MLEQRVGALEADMKDVKASLGRLELAFARIEEKFAFVSTKEDLARVEAKLGEKIATLDGKVSNLPSTWQVIGILAGLLVGVASLVYATDKFLSHSRNPAPVSARSNG